MGAQRTRRLDAGLVSDGYSCVVDLARGVGQGGAFVSATAGVVVPKRSVGAPFGGFVALAEIRTTLPDDSPVWRTPESLAEWGRAACEKADRERSEHPHGRQPWATMITHKR